VNPEIRLAISQLEDDNLELGVTYTSEQSSKFPQRILQMRVIAGQTIFDQINKQFPGMAFPDS